MSGTYSPYQGPPQGPGGYPAPPNPGARYIDLTYIECLSYMTESWVILGTTCLNWYLCRFPTYTPGQQRGPSPPQNLGQRPPNAGEDLVEKPIYFISQVAVPNNTRCTPCTSNNHSSSKRATLSMCLRSVISVLSLATSGQLPSQWISHKVRPAQYF